ncbi:hypothetical protein [Streptomyces sp. NPDC053367]|uniref:hypothetical protein n=1 Tax=Streptomyces sp. NPDC053367 TaxID=3365700 RepID=UPI0037D4B2E6
MADSGVDETAVLPKAVRPRQSPETLPGGPGERLLPRRERGGAAGTPRGGLPGGATAPGGTTAGGWPAAGRGRHAAPAPAPYGSSGTAAPFTASVPSAPAAPFVPSAPAAPSTASTSWFTGADTGLGADATAVLPTAPAPHDPWAETEDADQQPVAAPNTQEHDPHEVTVQLDAVQLGDVALRPVKGGLTGATDGSDGPVFVDETGRRSRRWRRLGMAVGLACAVYAVVIVATLLSGSSDAPWLPVPEKGGKPAGKVDSPALPSDSVQPSGPGASMSPEADPSATAGSTPAAGATPGAAGAAPTAEAPAGRATTTPGPAATRSTAPLPGGGVTQPDPEPTETATEPDPEPTTPSEDPTTADPSTETGGTDGGSGDGGTTANGPLASDPVAREQGGSEPSTLAAPPSAQPSPSPEYLL